MTMRVVSREEMQAVLLEHAEHPTKLVYRPLPELLPHEKWESLTPERQALYRPEEDTRIPGSPDRFLTYRRTPGDCDAWVVE